MRSHLLVLLAGILLIVLWPASASAAVTGSISGTVTDTAGSPLRSICVMSYDSSGNPLEAVSVNVSGDYEVDSLQPGSYKLEFIGCGEGDDVVSEFYDDEKTVAQATPIAVEAATETSGIDAQLEPAGSISGTVTDSAGSPLSVCVRALDSTGFEADVDSTDQNGNYELTGLAAGPHRIQFWGCGEDLAPEFYDDAGTLAEATPVMVEAGSNVAGIDAQLVAGGSISGQITDSAGNPMRWSCVEVYDSSGAEVGSDSSDSDGRYRVGSLGTGDYRVRFLGCSNNLAPEFYDDAETLVQATPVPVEAGSEMTGIDAELAPGGSISGTVTDSAGVALKGVCVQAYDSSGAEADSASSDSNGHYSVIGLDGDYRLEFDPCSSDHNVLGEFYEDAETLAQATPVSAPAGSEVTGVDVELQVGGSITGSLSDVLAAPADGDVCLSSVTAYDEGGNYVGSASLGDSGGSYTIDQLETGDYRLEFRSTCVVFPGGFPWPELSDSITEFYDNRETLEEATPVAVTAGSVTSGIVARLGRNGSISGRISDSSGDPVQGVCAWAYDSEGEMAGSGPSGADGYYTVAGLGTGSYRVAFHRCSYMGPNVLSEFYDVAETLQDADPVAVTDDADTPGIDAQLATGGSISGTVTDASGAPLNGLCVQTFDATGTPVEFAMSGPDGTYQVRGLETSTRRVKFSDCLELKGFTVTPEFYDNVGTFEQATPLSVTTGADVPGIDAQLATQSQPAGTPGDQTPPPGPSPTDPTVYQATIGKLTVRGRAKLMKGKKATFRVGVSNTGNAEAAGVSLRVRGRGVHVEKAIGAVAAGATRTVKVTFRPKKTGRATLTFSASSAEAGSQTAQRRVRVAR